MGRQLACALLLLACCRAAAAQTTSPAEASSSKIYLPSGKTLEFITPNIVHITSTNTRITQPGFSVLPRNGPGPHVTGGGFGGQTVYSGGGELRVLPENNGDLSFTDARGTQILREAPDGTTLTPTTVQGQSTLSVRQQWLHDPAEMLFGLGQHQYDFLNLAGHDFTLWQRNTEIAIPLLVSSKGYAILWNNASPTQFGDPRDFVAIPPDHLLAADGTPGGLTATTFADQAFTQKSATRTDPAINVLNAGAGRGNRNEQAIRWQGQIAADTDGNYQFKLYANGGYKLWIDGKLLADHWRQNWLPGDELVTRHFTANSKHALRLDWSKDQGTTCQLTWKTPDPNDNISFQSMAGEGVDYYLIYGGEGPGAIDRLIAGYRDLTGQAPMMPVWAFGLWQSRQRYETQQASLDVVKGFRDRHIPFDTIVQDWMYWRENDWGSHQFDPARFPDPTAWIKDIHEQHAHLMISVWPKFYPTTDNAKQMQEKGFLFPVNPRERDWVGRGYAYTFYDAFNPDARKLFWQQIDQALFSKGVDAWWMDATEPDLTQPSPATLDRQMADMPGKAAVMNAYPLVNSEAIYEGQRAAAPDQRVFILTRSGFAGMQRYAAASWSGDITSSWSAMRKQIIAGLDYSLSGMPYWTMDSGGFSVPAKWSTRNPTPENLDEWRELNARWFEFAAFVPLLRVHGESPYREMWQFGGGDSPACRAMLQSDHLRYRLLPYIYSLAGDVTQNNATFMRPLLMDFPADNVAAATDDEYLFGPSILVSPVTTYKARSRSVYLPPTPGGWYDFWTGRHVDTPTGQSHDTDAPFDQIPLHIRAGSILPLGPDLQYTTEKPADPLTLLVYSGADADFSLYEDDGLTYACEKNQFTRIPLHWNDAAQTLTIGQRTGAFPTMLQHRTVNIILLRPDKPVPYSPQTPPDKSIQYAGQSIEVKF